MPDLAVLGWDRQTELRRNGTRPARGEGVDPPPSSCPVAPDFAALTRREIEVLWLLIQRQTDREIAEALCLGLRTVESHVASILSKLAVTNRREAAKAALRLGLLGASPAGTIVLEF